MTGPNSSTAVIEYACRAAAGRPDRPIASIGLAGLDCEQQERIPFLERQ